MLAMVLAGAPISATRRLSTDADRFLLTSVDLPVVTQISEASAWKPYPGLTMELDLRVMSELMLNNGRPLRVEELGGRVGRSTWASAATFDPRRP